MPPGPEQRRRQAYMDRAAALHRQHMVIDGHCDAVLGLAAGLRSLGTAQARGHFDLPRARRGGLGGQIFALWSAPEFTEGLATRRVLSLLDILLAEVEVNGGQLHIVRTAADFDLAWQSRRLAAMIGIEGGDALGTLGAPGALKADLSILRCFYRLGVRVLGLTWNYRNGLADGALEWQSGGGLTRFGRAVIAEMNRLGMVIDTAHLAPAGFEQVLALSEHPVLFSHGNCRAFFDHPRNLTDSQIRALARQGGVFGISFVNAFMADAGAPPPSVSTVADHIEHVCHLLGNFDHVALGSDFDGTDAVPDGLESVACLPQLTAELLSRGLPESAVIKFLGGNYLRVFRKVLPAAASPQT